MSDDAAPASGGPGGPDDRDLPHDEEVVDTTGEGPPTAAAERFVAVAFGVSIVAALGLAAVYWTGGQPQLEGALLALALGGVGVGMVAWAKRFLPHEELAEARGRLGSAEEEVAAFAADFERGEQAIERRGLLLKLLAAALGALGVAAVFPIRSLGPRPGRGLFDTAYRPGLRLVTEGGRPVRPDEVDLGGLVTAWPEGHQEAADAPTLLIRVRPGQLELPPDRRDWVIDDSVVAYSKLCTHLGCPVGLYQAQFHLLLCPCHQSTFDVLEGARPVFGPATRPLPQLPIGVDREGFIVARGDFPDAVGAGFWERPG